MHICLKFSADSPPKFIYGISRPSFRISCVLLSSQLAVVTTITVFLSFTQNTKSYIGSTMVHFIVKAKQTSLPFVRCLLSQLCWRSKLPWIWPSDVSCCLKLIWRHNIINIHHGSISIICSVISTASFAWCAQNKASTKLLNSLLCFSFCALWFWLWNVKECVGRNVCNDTRALPCVDNKSGKLVPRYE